MFDYFKIKKLVDIYINYVCRYLYYILKQFFKFNYMLNVQFNIIQHYAYESYDNYIIKLIIETIYFQINELVRIINPKLKCYIIISNIDLKIAFYNHSKCVIIILNLTNIKY